MPFYLPLRSKWCFMLLLLVGRINDFTNLIGQKQQFVCWAFTLVGNNQQMTPSKMPTWEYFLRLVKNGDPNSLQENKLFFQAFTKCTI
jgi:hypothetical protein